eukprot:1437551-Alexandrium_andersonii.AAC.1
MDVIIRAAELADAMKFKGKRRNVTSRLNGLLANAGLPGLRRLVAQLPAELGAASRELMLRGLREQ